MPGHTKGSFGILTKEGDLISGDTLCNMKKPGIAANAVDFKVLKNSVRRIKSLGVKRVFPGHGEPFSGDMI